MGKCPNKRNVLHCRTGSFCQYSERIPSAGYGNRYNPYREWVGAQIRADYYGYINPGNPGAAAEYAFRDASISHVKNGIYGSMFVASMISRAAVSSSTSDIVRTGLRCIPKTSRLYKAVSEVIDGYENGINFSDWSARFNKEWNDEIQHHWCHVISNACIVTAAGFIR